MKKIKKIRHGAQKASEPNDIKSHKRRRNFSLTSAKHRLTGSRFRTLNEKLYTSTSEDNFSYYKRNPGLFEVYHEGYQEQVSKWPFNPLTRVIAWLEEQRDDKVIGDFGCGEAMIAQRFHDRTVHSFDLIAGNPLITACNMTKVPLNDNTLDICVFCLSLMGQDWPLFVVEATRCLKEGGVIKIVEVRSRLTSIEEFEKFLESLGYKKDNALLTDESDFFVFFQFTLCKKSPNDSAQKTHHTSQLLLPCPYKRR